MIPHSLGYSSTHRGLMDEGQAHRVDYSRCPWCYKDVDVHVWVTTPKVKEVILKNPRFNDRGKVIIIGECPYCSMPSWGHWEVNLLGLYARDEPEKYPYDMELIKANTSF